MVRAATRMRGLGPDAAERQAHGGFLYGDHQSLCGQRLRQRGCCSACKLRSDPQKPGESGQEELSTVEGKEDGEETQLRSAARQERHLQRQCIRTAAPGTAWGLVNLRGQ